MGGLENFTIFLWFTPKEDHPAGLNTNGNGGVIICSNWAMGNMGDWLLGFTSQGNLYFVIQDPTIELFGMEANFLKNEVYEVKIVKTKCSVKLYINNQLQDFKPYHYALEENGAPLSIGANPYDRDGMGFFNGVIGGIIITTQQ